MKKPVIFLFIFTVSLFTFAQEKSQYAENFSLTEHLKADNYRYYKFEISSSTDNLFSREKSSQSKQLQAFQLLYEPHQLSERTSLLRAAAFENREQNWRGISYFRYGQQQEIISVEPSASLAESYLRRLAERSKKDRKTWRTLGLIGGGLVLGLGAVALASAEEAGGWEGLGLGLVGIMLIPSGVALVGVGIYSLAIPSRAERELDGVMSIKEFAQRERASQEALSSLAVKGKRDRILSGVSLSALSAYFLVGQLKGSRRESYDEDSNVYLSALFSALLAAKNFLWKSRAERAYQNYLKAKEQQKELAVRIGIMPHGGIKIGLALSY